MLNTNALREACIVLGAESVVRNFLRSVVKADKAIQEEGLVLDPYGNNTRLIEEAMSFPGSTMEEKMKARTKKFVQDMYYSLMRLNKVYHEATGDFLVPRLEENSQKEELLADLFGYMGYLDVKPGDRILQVF
jgi:hypothetical protein